MKVVKTKSFATKTFIKNSDAILDIYKIYSEEIPVLYDSISANNMSYVTSFISQYLLYTREEVLKSSKYTKQQKHLARYLSPLALQLAKRFVKKNLVWVNNNITSTPLYNLKWDSYDIDKLSKRFSKQNPNKTIIYKSIEPTSNPELFQKFNSDHYIPLLGRQVYIFNPHTSKYKKKRSYQKDKKLAENQDRFYWTTLDLKKDKEVDRVLELYKKLYLDKHSVYNPIYTKAFIKEGIDNFRLSYNVLKEKENDTIVAVQGIYETERVINTSFIGYDQTLPQELGLYRLMNYKLMRQAVEKGKLLNMSSGAGDFKMKRGGVPSFEYQMIYQSNLSSFQRKVWAYLAKLLEKTAKQQMKDLKV